MKLYLFMQRIIIVLLLASTMHPLIGMNVNRWPEGQVRSTYNQLMAVNIYAPAITPQTLIQNAQTLEQLIPQLKKYRALNAGAEQGVRAKIDEMRVQAAILQSQQLIPPVVHPSAQQPQRLGEPLPQRPQPRDLAPQELSEPVPAPAPYRRSENDKKTIRELEQQIRQLRQQVQNLENILSRPLKPRPEDITRLRELEDLNQQLQTELRQLQAQLARITKTSGDENNHLKQMLQKLEQDLAAKDNELAQLTEKTDKERKHEAARTRELSAQVEQLQAQIEKQLQQLNEQNKALQNKNQDAQAQLALLKEIQQEKLNLVTTSEQLNQQLEAANQAKITLEQKLEREKRELMEKEQKEREAMQGLLDREQQALANERATKKQEQKTRTELATLQAQLETQTQQAAELQQNSAAQADKNKQLLAEVDRLAELERTREQEIKRQAALIAEKTQALETERKAMQEKESALAAEQAKLTSLLKEQEQALEGLRKQLEETRKSASQQQQKSSEEIKKLLAANTEQVTMLAEQERQINNLLLEIKKPALVAEKQQLESELKIVKEELKEAREESQSRRPDDERNRIAALQEEVVSLKQELGRRPTQENIDQLKKQLASAKRTLARSEAHVKQLNEAAETRSRPEQLKKETTTSATMLPEGGIREQSENAQLLQRLEAAQRELTQKDKYDDGTIAGLKAEIEALMKKLKAKEEEDRKMTAMGKGRMPLRSDLWSHLPEEERKQAEAQYQQEEEVGFEGDVFDIYSETALREGLAKALKGLAVEKDLEELIEELIRFKKPLEDKTETEEEVRNKARKTFNLLVERVREFNKKTKRPEWKINEESIQLASASFEKEGHLAKAINDFILLIKQLRQRENEKKLMEYRTLYKKATELGVDEKALDDIDKRKNEGDSAKADRAITDKGNASMRKLIEELTMLINQKEEEEEEEEGESLEEILQKIQNLSKETGVLEQAAGVS